jgi:hypothetical protein
LFGRWSGRSQSASSVGGGNKFEDAALSGAIAIYIPTRFAPLVAGRWERLQENQHATYLNRRHSSHSRKDWQKLRKNHPDLVQDFYAYIVPPGSTFEKYKEHKIYPTSGLIRQVIAIFQVGISSYNLYGTYIDTIREDGLSSPYLIVVPYTIMSIVNYICVSLVGSYT